MGLSQVPHIVKYICGETGLNLWECSDFVASSLVGKALIIYRSRD